MDRAYCGDECFVGFIRAALVPDYPASAGDHRARHHIGTVAQLVATWREVILFINPPSNRHQSIDAIRSSVQTRQRPDKPQDPSYR